MVWPNLVLAKLGLAKLGLGQTWSGQTWSWPNLVWPNLDLAKLGLAKLGFGRHIRARVRFGPTALVRNLPERGHAALCLPNTSKGTPHSHLASVTARGSRNLSKTNVLNKCGSIVNSNVVGAPCNAAPDLGLNGTDVGLDGGTRLGKDHGFSEVALERRGSVVLPTVFTRFDAAGLWKPHASSQLPPTGTAHKPTLVQNACCLVQVFETSLWIGIQDNFDSILSTLADAPTTWAKRLPMKPNGLQVLSWTLIGVPSPPIS